MSYSQVADAWCQAGGNPQAAQMAAAIADATSGMQPGLTRSNTDGTTSVGLWGISNPGVPPGSTDPIANARAAVQQSNNGTDWSQWCVAWSDNNCGQSGGQYLAPGSNALAGLAANINPSSYSVAGSQPAGNGTSASSATGTTTTGTSSSSGLRIILLLALVALLATAYFLRHREAGEHEPAISSRAQSVPKTEPPSSGSQYVQGYYR